MFLAIAKSYELCALKQMQSLLWSSVFSLEQWNKWPNIRAAVGDDIFKNTYLKSPQILFLNNVPQCTLGIWGKHSFVSTGIRNKTFGCSNCIPRGFLSAGLSFCGKQENTGGTWTPGRLGGGVLRAAEVEALGEARHCERIKMG